MRNSTFVATLALALIVALGGCSPKKAYYQGRDISEIGKIRRDKHTKKATLEVTTSGDWTIYGARTVADIDPDKPLASGNGSGVFDLDVPSGERYYFQLDTDEGKGILAERHLPMEGGYNYRDLGGFRAEGGRYVKWGLIFRSDDMHNLTQSDLDYLAGIPVVSIVDFRSPGEVAAAPDKLPSSVAKDYGYSISPGDIHMASSLHDLSESSLDSLMIAMNVSLVSDSAIVSRYRDLFALLQEPDKVPLMFHCSAGKDRTGMAAALVLYALGVDEETIMKDYLWSNVFLDDKYAALIMDNPNLRPLFQVEPYFLKAGIDRIKADYGTVCDFLEKRLDVDIEKFRETYLY